MFFEDGWVPLSEVTFEVFRRLQALQTEGKITAPNGLTKTLAISVWDICDACTKIGVTGPDGTVIAASKDLVAWADPRELSNEHIHLVAGTIGSTTLKDDTGNAPARDDLIARYGGFLNMPVVIPVNNFQSSLTFLEEEVVAEGQQSQAVTEAARTILKMVDDGGLVTREIARLQLGSSLSRRKFKQAWGLAAQHSPDLARPNRWQGL